MTYQGEQLLYIYAADGRNPNRLTRPSTKTMYTYLEERDGGRPQLVAKFGEGLYPVRRRAGRNYIIVGETAASQPAPRPASPRPASVEAAVAEMVAMGKERNPHLAKRLDSAAELVLDGRVNLAGEEARLGPYTITAEACTCLDFQHRGGWCKHRLAVRMARHLVANRFELPRPKAVETTPQISARNLALINSGQVVEEERRRRLAYYESHHAAHTAALRRLGNGAKSLPADLARRAGIVKNREVSDGRVWNWSRGRSTRCWRWSAGSAITARRRRSTGRRRTCWRSCGESGRRRRRGRRGSRKRPTSSVARLASSR